MKQTDNVSIENVKWCRETKKYTGQDIEVFWRVRSVVFVTLFRAEIYARQTKVYLSALRLGQYRQILQHPAWRAT